MNASGFLRWQCRRCLQAYRTPARECRSGAEARAKIATADNDIQCSSGGGVRGPPESGSCCAPFRAGRTPEVRGNTIGWSPASSKRFHLSPRWQAGCELSIVNSLFFVSGPGNAPLSKEESPESPERCASQARGRSQERNLDEALRPTHSRDSSTSRSLMFARRRPSSRNSSLPENLSAACAVSHPSLVDLTATPRQLNLFATAHPT